LPKKVAQPDVCQSQNISVTVEKSSPKTLAAFEIFKKLPKENYHPTGENSPNLVALVTTYTF
jgi:hypothetical protein